MNKFTIRSVTDDDCRFVYDLNMEPSVREGSVRSEYFSFEQHQEWWARRAHEEGTRIYIAQFDRTPIGQVRYGRAGTAAEIAIAVLPVFRRHGHARRMLELSEPMAKADLGVSRFIALVLASNTPSRRLFEASGYRLTGWEERMRRICRRYEKTA